MKKRILVAALLAGSSVALALTVQRPSPQADVAELFDPAFIARSMCGVNAVSGMFIPPAAAQDTPPATRIYEGLGDNSFKITTGNERAQAYFDQGLKLVYAFNYGEALASFRAGSAADPTCAMCFWGEGLALGQTLNASMPDENNAPALAAARKAQDLGGAATPRERALIAALALRYSDDPKKTRDQLNAAYADAMAKVHQQFDGDIDLASLHADAALNDSRQSGWWTPDGRLPTPRNASALVALEQALKLAPEHAGAIHYYIHAMDSGPRPERAEPYANKLAALMPAAGHLVHMPAHIYYRRGRYIDALNANIDALKVDDAYLAQTNNADSVYSHALYAHNLHFAFASAGMAGDTHNALALAGRLEEFLAKGGVARPDYYSGAALMARLKSGTPEEILRVPEPPEAAIYVRGLWRYARASAYVMRGDVVGARKERDALVALRTNTDPDRMMQSNGRTPQMLQLAEDVVNGRIAAQEKKWDEAVKHFTKAAAAQDQLRSFDPPAWDFPVRQAIGLTLLKAGRTDAAIKALREALMDAPNNGTVLYALAEASKTAKDSAGEAQYRVLFKKAWAGDKAPDLGRI